jgi:hypothetical protein
MTIKDYKHSLVLYQDHNLHQKTIDWCTEQFGSSGLKESGCIWILKNKVLGEWCNGSHASLRNLCRKTCRFESDLAHHLC